jgi:hypothetical protein
MERVCLTVGIGDAPPLDYLRGAVNGAHAIAEWAQAQGYVTRLLTDEHDPVEFDDLKTELSGLLAGGAERLLLYFAGHGLSPGAADDLWLLSQWDKVRQGVSVTALRNRLTRYGVRQLVVVSDACRTLIDANTSDVTGYPVLERGRFEETLPQMDLWFAASPSRAAWMIPGRTPAESRCIFSGLLKEALDGVHTAAFDPEDPTRGITSFSLADFLEGKVPEVAAWYGATLKPAITTAIRPPRNIYVPGGPHPPAAAALIPWPDPSAVRVAGMGSSDGGGRVVPLPDESWTTRQQVTLESTTRGSRGPDIRSVPAPSLAAVIADDDAALTNTTRTQQQLAETTLAAFQAENRPDHFETGAGFTLSHANAVRGLLGPPAKAHLLGNTGWWRIERSHRAFHGPWWTGGSRIRQPLRQPLPLLVELADGRWVGAAALPNFVLSFTLNEVGAQAVIYRSMDMPQAPETEAAMAQLRADGLRRERAPELLQQLRRAKHADPMLGVLAAYLHEAMGDLANVHRTAFYFAERGEAIPFDIALLGRLAAHRSADGLVRVVIPAVAKAEGARNIPGYMKNATPEAEGVLAGAFPWMRQGWALLDPEGRPDLYPAGLADIAAHLLSAPFTTLDAQGGARLATLLFPTE